MPILYTIFHFLSCTFEKHVFSGTPPQPGEIKPNCCSLDLCQTLDFRWNGKEDCRHSVDVIIAHFYQPCFNICVCSKKPAPVCTKCLLRLQNMMDVKVPKQQSCYSSITHFHLVCAPDSNLNLRQESENHIQQSEDQQGNQ